jgi:hypothetical protein
LVPIIQFGKIAVDSIKSRFTFAYKVSSVSDLAMAGVEKFVRFEETGGHGRRNAFTF